MKTVVSTIKATTNTTASNNNLNSAGDATTAGNITIIPKSEPDNTGDIGLQFQTPNAVISNTNSNANKRPLSLDLNKTTKKLRLTAPSPLLMETVNTPELEKIILSNHLLQTPRPGIVYPSKVGEVTTEQEEYVKGFEEALIKIHNSKSAQTNPTTNAVTSTVATQVATVTTAGAGMSGGSFTYTNLDSFTVVVKDEPQNPPVSPTVQPIDMENQELIKLERKRLRNRVAASKCRKRKLERISKLEDKVKMLKSENTDLGSILKSLKDHVAQLKQEVMQHLDFGCSIPPVCNGNTLLSAK